MNPHKRKKIARMQALANSNVDVDVKVENIIKIPEVEKIEQLEEKETVNEEVVTEQVPEFVPVEYVDNTTSDEVVKPSKKKKAT